jgi:hypothetical protein
VEVDELMPRVVGYLTGPVGLDSHADHLYEHHIWFWHMLKKKLSTFFSTEAIGKLPVHVNEDVTNLPCTYRQILISYSAKTDIYNKKKTSNNRRRCSQSWDLWPVSNAHRTLSHKNMNADGRAKHHFPVCLTPPSLHGSAVVGI